MVIRFGASRHQGGADLAKKAQRFADLVAGTVRASATCIIKGDYDQLLDGILVGGITLAWLPPIPTLRAMQEGAMVAAVSERGGASSYRCALLVRADSQYHGLGDLVGCRFAWTDSQSASGYLFPRLFLGSRGLNVDEDLQEETFLGTPAAACAAVADGTADLCPCYVGEKDALDPERALATVRRLVGDVAGALRVIGVTGAIPPDAMVIAGGLDGWMQSRLRDALLTLHETGPGAAALADLVDAERLAPVTVPIGHAFDELRAVLGRAVGRQKSGR